MKKVIVVIALFLFIPKTFGQQEYDKQITEKPIFYISERLPALNIDTITQTKVNYISMIRCPQYTIPVEILYIIDGIPGKFESFEKLDPESILNSNVVNHKNFHFCVPYWGIITITTIKSLKKRELRKLKRLDKG